MRHIREGQVTDRLKSDHEIRSHSLASGTTTWKYILFNPSLMANNLAFFSFGYLLFFATTWLPGYMQMTYGLHLKEVGIFLIAPWLTAAIMILNAGWLSDWLYKKTGSLRIARTHMIWSCQLLSALCFIPVMFSPSLELAITMISLGIGLGLMPNAAFYAINCDLAKDRAATSLGVMDTFFAAAGILAPTVTGLIEQRTGGFAGAFGVLIALMGASVVAVLFFQKPDAEKSLA
jgi:MFS transporter, ACS family, hexuronate transporter